MNQMRSSLLALTGFLFVLANAHRDALGAPLSRTIPSSDHALNAVVTPIGREAKESRVEIQNSDGRALCTEDYSSADGEHGLAVTEDRWTPDSRFFVYSTSSSGGHQPYHAPTFFYSRRHNRVRDIQELTHRMVVDQAPDAEFKIVPPDTLALVTADDGMKNLPNTLEVLNTVASNQ